MHIPGTALPVEGLHRGPFTSDGGQRLFAIGFVEYMGEEQGGQRVLEGPFTGNGVLGTCSTVSSPVHMANCMPSVHCTA